MRSFFIWLLSAITISGSAQASDTTRHNVVRLGKVVGKHLSWKTGANDQYYYFEFNDRGRGPSITSHSKTDNKGNILFQEISGVDYFKTKVEEKVIQEHVANHPVHILINNTGGPAGGARRSVPGPVRRRAAGRYGHRLGPGQPT